MFLFTYKYYENDQKYLSIINNYCIILSYNIKYNC